MCRGSWFTSGRAFSFVKIDVLQDIRWTETTFYKKNIPNKLHGAT